MVVVGIDPGLTGAVAFIGLNSVKVFDLPTVEIPGNGMVKRRVHGPALHDIMLANCPPGEPIMVLIENVMQSMGGQGSAAQTQGSLMQTFGTVQCCIEILGVEPVLINSRKWKNFYKLDSEKKNSLECARRLWPTLKEIARAKDHNRAESLLIAQYGLQNLT